MLWDEGKWAVIVVGIESSQTLWLIQYADQKWLLVDVLWLHPHNCQSNCKVQIYVEIKLILDQRWIVTYDEWDVVSFPWHSQAGWLYIHVCSSVLCLALIILIFLSKCQIWVYHLTSQVDSVANVRRHLGQYIPNGRWPFNKRRQFLWIKTY